NQALKKKVFGPVETARIERQNAKLLALAQAPKELVMEDNSESLAQTTSLDPMLTLDTVEADREDPTSAEKEPEESTKDTTMDVDEESGKP
ncbi:UNVERIFIED_CONTAM: DUF2423 domain-containing protein, partial [Bacteroidetes bacterium 56_B9]